MNAVTLFTATGRQYLLEEYVKKERSTYDIAETVGTYPNMVRRALIYHKIELRTKSQAQEKALKAGRSVHPTKGKARSEETRAAIKAAMDKRAAQALVSQEQLNMLSEQFNNG